MLSGQKIACFSCECWCCDEKMEWWFNVMNVLGSVKNAWPVDISTLVLLMVFFPLVFRFTICILKMLYGTLFNDSLLFITINVKLFSTVNWINPYYVHDCRYMYTLNELPLAHLSLCFLGGSTLTCNTFWPSFIVSIDFLKHYKYLH